MKGLISLLVVLAAIALLVWGMTEVHEIRSACEDQAGLLVKAPGEGFWGYACIEKGQH